MVLKTRDTRQWWEAIPERQSKVSLPGYLERGSRLMGREGRWSPNTSPRWGGRAESLGTQDGRAPQTGYQKTGLPRRTIPEICRGSLSLRWVLASTSWGWMSRRLGRSHQEGEGTSALPWAGVGAWSPRQTRNPGIHGTYYEHRSSPAQHAVNAGPERIILSPDKWTASKNKAQGYF